MRKKTITCFGEEVLPILKRQVLKITTFCILEDDSISDYEKSFIIETCKKIIYDTTAKYKDEKTVHIISGPLFTTVASILKLMSEIPEKYDTEIYNLTSENPNKHLSGLEKIMIKKIIYMIANIKIKTYINSKLSTEESYIKKIINSKMFQFGKEYEKEIIKELIEMKKNNILPSDNIDKLLFRLIPKKKDTHD